MTESDPFLGGAFRAANAEMREEKSIMTKNPYPYSDSIKRYQTYDYYLRHRFGGKCFKVSLDGGFTCPNRDGTKGTGGCTFCGGSYHAGYRSLSIPAQFAAQKELLGKKWKDATRFIAYFQSFTNTYAPLDVLREKYETALAEEGVVGLSIATRADCLGDDVVDYLRELHERTYLTVELGLQTVHDETARRIRRGHTYAEFLEGYRRLEGLNICVHLINGLPGEDRAAMLETAERVAGLRPHAVKLHLLYIIEGTPLAEEYRRGEFRALTLDEYVDVTVSQLERFAPETVIGRVTGDGEKDKLIAPLWSLKKFVVLNELDKEFLRRDTCQGILYG